MPEQADLKKFTALLKKRHAQLRVWASKLGIECYRVYHRDIGSIPLMIDIYGKYLHVVLHEQEGGKITEDQMLQLVTAAGNSLYFPEERIFFKYRERLTDKKQYSRYASEGVWAEVQEYGLTFHVNLSDYLDTGLFLDHRDTRLMVRENAAGMNVLNLYGYTGAFSVYAADGGAMSTTTVDLSNVYLQWAQKNMTSNGFIAKNHEYINEDVAQFLKAARKGRRKWDLIILDPPTFSNSRKMEKVLDIQKDHAALLEACFSISSKKGAIIFSTNSRKFVLDRRIADTHFVRDLTNQTMPEDFMGTKIHKCWIIRK
ncbi:MAG: class I SAM-dependent methyltransferase [Spirochaetales bacterium]|nr:class I SAM-dependent methyltransferase [Spirochaetales bacterium]